MPHTWDPTSPSPIEALRRLREGNLRFREGSTSISSGSAPETAEGVAASAARPTLLAMSWDPKHASSPQSPFAIILGCSDSRTPVEILFDQGFGELFVVRIAGNIVAPSVVGSIEFAASQYGTRLVVVMGHTRCGAVTATVDAIQTGMGPASKNIQSITDRITPHVEDLVRHEMSHRPEDRASLMREAVRANVRASADHLRHGSRIIEELVLAKRLVVVGAEYELETGVVDFFDGEPISET
ncbi:MAG: carbonic anhydrase [Deltaproteobacteria bacterium]|nr:carbonic anhydrase [Deltaproteobacteria bacterium]